MIKNIKLYFKRKITPILMAGITGITFIGCTEKQKKIDTKETTSYTLEQYEDYEFQYKVTKYNAEESKNKIYELKGIKKSYETKCTPKDFKKYLDSKEITWEILKQTVKESNFDEYHKGILLKGINNLQNNNFSMDLSVINYNIKNIKLKHEKRLSKDTSLGEFDCFNHEMTVIDNIDDKEKYEMVFLHEILGHGMTDAYIEETKTYCSIDQPVFIIDKNNNYIGNSLYGQAFNEAIAQIIAITAVDKELSPKYRCAYDMSMVELLMLCEDNNCKLVEYANEGVNTLTKKMKQNKIDDPNGTISMITYNLNEKVDIPSEEVMYRYFKNVVDNCTKEGKTIKQINDRISKAFNSYRDYVLELKDNNDSMVGLDYDIINLTRLYNDIGKYAMQTNKTK